MTAKKPKEAVVIVDLENHQVYVVKNEEEAAELVTEYDLVPADVVMIKGQNLNVKKARNSVEFYDLIAETEKL